MNIPRRQARALLYRLAVTDGPASRETLCYTFWPDAEETVARHNLSRLITILHNSLPDPDLLLTRNDQIILHAHLADSDTRAFERLWTRWIAGGDLACLRQAVALYRGPFLDGFYLPDSPEFDTWASLERERWTRLILQALAALIEALAIDADYGAAIGYAQRYLAIDELAEEIHRRLIEFYALVGNRSAALQQYERCVAELERGLGVDPMPKTQAVYQAVLHGDDLGALADAGLPKALWPVAQTPLIGRAAALDLLDEAYRQARAGHASAVLIIGEPGVGKSRLIQEFTGHVRGQALVLIGGCYPETRTSPYQPIVEALRPRLGMLRFEFEANPPWLADLSHLFPELGPAHPSLSQPPADEPGWARTRLFEALETLLLTLALGAQPIVLCLDDLHAADCATLDWLSFLSRHGHNRPLLIVGAYLSEEAAALSGFRSSLARQGMLRELTLEGLDQEAVREIVRHVGGQITSDPTLTVRLQQATAGNPFFLLQTLAALTESEAHSLPEAERYPLPLPDSVRQAVQIRITRLRPTTRQVLETAAVIGQAFSADTIPLISGRTEMEAADSLDELATRELLVENRGWYRFRHEIVREIVYRDLGAYRRRLLHRRTGETLERMHPEDFVALARHYEGAGLPGQAARFALQAGLVARRVFAHVEARIHFDRALTMLEQEAEGLQNSTAIAANRRLRIQALSERGWALRLLGDMTAYARDLEQEAGLAELLGDTGTLAHLRWRQASAHLWFCRYADARSTAEDGLQLARSAGDSLLEAFCCRAIGLAARAVGDYNLAQSHLEQALNLFAALDQPAYQVHTLGNLSTLYWCQNAWAQALTMAQQAMTVCESAGLSADRRLPLGDIGAAAIGLGDVALARQSLTESLAIARQVNDRTQEILCLGHLGWLDVQERRGESALDSLHAALLLAEQVNSLAEQSWLHAGLAEALQLLGDLDAVAAHVQQASALADATGQAHDQRLARQVLARLHDDLSGASA